MKIFGDVPPIVHCRRLDAPEFERVCRYVFNEVRRLVHTLVGNSHDDNRVGVGPLKCMRLPINVRLCQTHLAKRTQRLARPKRWNARVVANAHGLAERALQADGNGPGIVLTATCYRLPKVCRT